MAQPLSKSNDWEESEYAHSQLAEIRLGLSTTIAAITLLACDDVSKAKLQALLAVKTSFSASVDKEAIDRFVARIMENAEGHSDQGFHTFRATALISMCAALESLIKNILVQWMDPTGQQVKALDSTKIRFKATDLLLASERERKFADADVLWKDGSAANGHFEKVEKLFSLHLPHSSKEFTKSTSDISRADFNTAFVVRNCLVHDGGLANNQVAQHTKFAVGEKIILTNVFAGRLFKAIEGTGSAAWVSTSL